MHRHIEVDYYLYRHNGNSWVLVDVFKTEHEAWERADNYPVTRIIKTTSELLP